MTELECLIISKICGNITDDENNALQIALDESEEARKLYDKISTLLTSPEALKCINAPSGKPPFSRSGWRIFIDFLRKIYPGR
jgi:hypothetical protein